MPSDTPRAAVSSNPDPLHREPDAPLPPLQSPMPRSEVLDREEGAFVDEADLPQDDEGAAADTASPDSAHDAAGEDSVAGEEDPGAGLDEAVRRR